MVKSKEDLDDDFDMEEESEDEIEEEEPVIRKETRGRPKGTLKNKTPSAEREIVSDEDDFVEEEMPEEEIEPKQVIPPQRKLQRVEPIEEPKSKVDDKKVVEKRYSAFYQPERCGLADLQSQEVIFDGLAKEQLPLADILGRILEKLEDIDDKLGKI